MGKDVEDDEGEAYEKRGLLDNDQTAAAHRQAAEADAEQQISTSGVDLESGDGAGNVDSQSRIESLMQMERAQQRRKSSRFLFMDMKTLSQPLSTIELNDEDEEEEEDELYVYKCPPDVTQLWKVWWVILSMGQTVAVLALIFSLGPLVGIGKAILYMMPIWAYTLPMCCVAFIKKTPQHFEVRHDRLRIVCQWPFSVDIMYTAMQGTVYSFTTFDREEGYDTDGRTGCNALFPGLFEPGINKSTSNVGFIKIIGKAPCRFSNVLFNVSPDYVERFVYQLRTHYQAYMESDGESDQPKELTVIEECNLAYFC